MCIRRANFDCSYDSVTVEDLYLCIYVGHSMSSFSAPQYVAQPPSVKVFNEHPVILNFRRIQR